MSLNDDCPFKRCLEGQATAPASVTPFAVEQPARLMVSIPAKTYYELTQAAALGRSLVNSVPTIGVKTGYEPCVLLTQAALDSLRDDLASARRAADVANRAQKSEYDRANEKDALLQKALAGNRELLQALRIKGAVIFDFQARLKNQRDSVEALQKEIAELRERLKREEAFALSERKRANAALEGLRAAEASRNQVGEALAKAEAHVKHLQQCSALQASTIKSLSAEQHAAEKREEGLQKRNDTQAETIDSLEKELTTERARVSLLSKLQPATSSPAAEFARVFAEQLAENVDRAVLGHYLEQPRKKAEIGDCWLRLYRNNPPRVAVIVAERPTHLPDDSIGGLVLDSGRVGYVVFTAALDSAIKQQELGTAAHPDSDVAGYPLYLGNWRALIGANAFSSGTIKRTVEAFLAGKKAL